MFELGSILLVKNYQLPTKVKDKFFIVIGIENEQITLMSMTTSQIYFDPSLIKHGTIKDRDMSIYCFIEKKVIGKNGFFFRQNTFISHRSNIFSFSIEKIKSLTIEYMDCLTKEEAIDLIYSFYSYAGIPKRYKSIFEKILHKLTEES